MRLPNAERAFVDKRKLSAYCLSAGHPVGRHKAVVFRSVFGFSSTDGTTLREWLLNATRSVEAEVGVADEFGQRYQVDFPAGTLAGTTAFIRSSWIVRPGEDFPRLTTCYVVSG